eukprot:maker-scaffold1615_size33485-snap-gene-0.14 protein:Tk10393 transcript:maker-scaffold1615_size33485-snap-gene-0.14-mRNA-1 annotation:"c11orf46 homolog"
MDRDTVEDSDSHPGGRTLRPRGDDLTSKYTTGAAADKERRRGLRNKVKSQLYDDTGICLANRRDLCDCLVDACPGCHFPCPKCGSHRCGLECRQNRKWQYETLELDGHPKSLRSNPHLGLGSGLK